MALVTREHRERLRELTALLETAYETLSEVLLRRGWLYLAHDRVFAVARSERVIDEECYRALREYEDEHRHLAAKIKHTDTLLDALIALHHESVDADG